MSMVKYIGPNRPGVDIADAGVFAPYNEPVEVPVEYLAGLLGRPDFEAADDEAEGYVPPPERSYRDVLVRDDDVLVASPGLDELGSPDGGGSGGAAPPRIVQAGNLTGTYTLDLDDDLEVWLVGTLTGNTTITLDALPDVAKVKLLVTQDATGGRTLAVTDGIAAAETAPVASDPAAVSVIDVLSADGSQLYIVGAGSGSGTPSGPFDPSAVGPLVADIDFSGLAGDGSPLASVPDASGNGFTATQSTSGARPTTETFAGIKAAHFDGDDWLTTTITRADLGGPTVGRPFTIATVASPDNLTAIWSFVASAGGGGIHIDTTISAGLVRLVSESTALIATSTIGVPAAAFSVVVVTYAADGTWEFRINGDLAGTGTNAVDFSTEPMLIGKGFLGHIAQFLVYEAVVALGDGLDDGLMAKYAIA